MSVNNAFTLDLSLLYRGSYMGAHVLLNSSNEMRKRDKMQGLLSILSLLYDKFNKFINTGEQMLRLKLDLL